MENTRERPNPIWNNSPQYLTGLAILTAILSTVVRLGYAENSEESFWVALAYRFITGGRPFLDELNVAQSASIALSWPTWIFAKVVPSLEGIFLFERILTLLVSIVTVCLTVRCLRSAVDRNAAILIALPILVFKVVGWPHWAHTTSAVFCFCLAVIFNLSATGTKGPNYLAFFSGAFHTLSVIFYAPFFAAIGPSFLAGVYYAASPRKRFATQFLSGAAVMCVIFWLVSGATPAVIADVLRFNSNFGYSSPAANYGIKQIMGLLLNKLPHRYLLLVCVTAIAVAWKRYPSLVPWIAISIPPLLFAAMPESPSPCLDYFFAWYCLAPLFYWMSPDRETARRWLAVAWLPSGAAGCSVVLLSHAGQLMSGTGFFAGSLVTSLLLYRILTNRSEGDSSGSSTRALAPFFLLFILQASLYLNWPLLAHNNYVLNLAGPWKGIRTSPEHYKQGEEYRKEVRPFIQKGMRIAVFPDWNDAYLVAETVPHTSFIWGCRLSSKAFNFCLDSQADYLRNSDLLVFSLPSSKATEEERLNWNKAREQIDGTHALAVQNPKFSIYRRR